MFDYGFKVVFADPKVLSEAGFAAVARLPLIFDSQPGYARFPNQFLIDRGLGYWDPKGRGAKRNPLPPSRISMRNFAWWLANALEWAETRGVDLMAADYTSVLIGRYQEEMLKGIWSAANRSLAPETVNARVQIAVEYQMWAADKGLRDPFVIPTVTTTYVAGSHDNSKSHEVKSVQSRKGKVKVNKCTLSFPRKDEIEAWRKRVHERPVFGKTEGLIVDLKPFKRNFNLARSSISHVVFDVFLKIGEAGFDSIPGTQARQLATCPPDQQNGAHEGGCCHAGTQPHNRA